MQKLTLPIGLDGDTCDGGCIHDHTKVAGVYGGGWSGSRPERRDSSRRGGYVPVVRVARELMGIDWMVREDLVQAIPPVYTEFIGLQLVDHLAVAA